MKLLSLFASLLSSSYHTNRKTASRKLYKQVHDQLRKDLGMKPIQWRKG